MALFWRGGIVDDFELRLSFRLKSGNSGIYYRAKQLLGYEVGGYQFEITGNQTGTLLESGPDRTRRQPSKWGTVTRIDMVKGKEKMVTESTNALKNVFRNRDWNEAVIIVRSNHVIHQLNGATIIETTDNYPQRPRSGTIAFEVYGTNATTVEFRDIRLKRLTP